MSAQVTGVLLPSDVLLPLKITTFQPDDLPLLREVVGGDIERVDLLQPAATLYTNEDGPRLRLPRNRRATLIARAANPSRRSREILGDAVLVGPPDDNRVDTSVPADYRDVLFTKKGRFRVEFQSLADERRIPLSHPVWSDVFQAYAQGLTIGRALPRQAVRVVPA
ncbi:protein of unknown function (DUF3846) [Frankia torreyi]|uniref:DUF3846 domain-containing protein n=1 Tax=Frankia torreyi TaxID=1856 RepID=A0A0D8B4R8_9ACTN|nr:MULTISPECIES: DUF3846 domain-containing protein [Frankia]KJE19268.1 protein of unknown function (DUF3846) [Frankia torreyi]